MIKERQERESKHTSINGHVRKVLTRCRWKSMRRVKHLITCVYNIMSGIGLQSRTVHSVKIMVKPIYMLK